MLRTSSKPRRGQVQIAGTRRAGPCTFALPSPSWYIPSRGRAVLAVRVCCGPCLGSCPLVENWGLCVCFACVCGGRMARLCTHPSLRSSITLALTDPHTAPVPACADAVCGAVCGAWACVCVCAWGMGVVWDKGLRWFGGALLRAPPVAEVTVLCTGCVCLCVLVSCVGVWVGGCGSCGNSGRTPFVVRRSIFLRGCGVGGVCVWWWGLIDVAPPPPPCATPLPPSVNARGPYSRVLWGCSCPHSPHLHLLPPPCVHPCFVSVFWPATVVCAPSPPFPTPSFPVRSPRVCFVCEGSGFPSCFVTLPVVCGLFMSRTLAPSLALKWTLKLLRGWCLVRCALVED